MTPRRSFVSSKTALANDCKFRPVNANDCKRLATEADLLA